jgi:ABC-2 type transport system permease protein
MMRELNAIFALGYREIVRFSRDYARIVVTFVFPIVFIGILGASLESNLGEVAGYSFITFAFTGVLGQILFQTTALGVIALREERESNLIQEVFVSPISRYTIILGKIFGESMVALTQCIGVILFGSFIGIVMTTHQMLSMLPLLVVVCLLGGSFGALILSIMKSPRGVQQVFPLLIVPQIFLAGVFSPIKILPFHVLFLSRIMPMTYAVDIVRSVFYRGLPEASETVIFSTHTDLYVSIGFFVAFIMIGTYLFVRGERNR